MSSKVKIEYITDFRFCSKDHFRILKGIAILLVLIAHFCETYLKIAGLEPLRTVASAVFLLCSGYGISESFNNKNGLSHYWENKVIRVWIPSFAVLLITTLASHGDAVAWIAHNPLALYGWFLYLLFAEYLAFWLAFYFLEQKYVRLLWLFSLSVIGFYFVETREVAVQVFCFPIGVLFSQNGMKYAVRELNNIGRLVLCIILLILSSVGCYLSCIIDQPYVNLLCTAVFGVSAAALLIIGVYFAKSLSIFGVFAPLGTISYALYLVHEPVLAFIQDVTQRKTTASVIVALFVIAALYSWLCGLLVRHNKKLRRKKATKLKGSMN